MKDEALAALMAAAGIGAPPARRIIERLEAQGMAIYKKKVFVNGKRPVSPQSMTPELAAEIRDYYAQNPEATQQVIANHFNVNSGRVNEVLHKTAEPEANSDDGGGYE